MTNKRFVLTQDHIDLLTSGRVGVDWQDCETGAPAIDPKRPYGNSDVAEDVAEILLWERTGFEDYLELTDEQRDRALQIHNQTETALEVILNAKTFEPGVYETSSPYSVDWRRLDDPA